MNSNDVMALNDPNFPPHLDIHPLDFSISNNTLHEQQKDIAQYGIAGRIWEASKPLIDYFNPENNSFDPPCPIHLSPAPRRIIELGSGQAVATLQLARHLLQDDRLVLTDLDNVVPLCEQSVQRWHRDMEFQAEIVVKPLAWGSDASSVKSLGPYDFIILCDLIYFPNLYPPLLCTLLHLTQSNEVSSGDTFGPTIIVSYHSRTLALEESFFDALGKYFETIPVTGTEGSKIYLCRRWSITEEWIMPSEREVMNGVKGGIRGRDFGFVDELFASLDYS